MHLQCSRVLVVRINAPWNSVSLNYAYAFQIWLGIQIKLVLLHVGEVWYTSHNTIWCQAIESEDMQPFCIDSFEVREYYVNCNRNGSQLPMKFRTGNIFVVAVVHLFPIHCEIIYSAVQHEHNTNMLNVKCKHSTILHTVGSFESHWNLALARYQRRCTKVGGGQRQQLLRNNASTQPAENGENKTRKPNITRTATNAGRRLNKLDKTYTNHHLQKQLEHW